MSQPRGSWLLWSDRQGTHELAPKTPPKPSEKIRWERSGDGRWLEVVENGVVIEVYIWEPAPRPGAGGAASRVAKRTRT